MGAKCEEAETGEENHFAQEFLQYCSFAYNGEFRGIVHFTVTHPDKPDYLFGLNCAPATGVVPEFDTSAASSSVAVTLSEDVFKEVDVA